jgi:CBS domain containing-hemolysin-like protein
MLSHAGSVPPVGAKVELEDGTSLEVLEGSARRIHKVRIRRRAAAE